MTPTERTAIEADCSLAEDPNTGYIPSLMSSLATHCRAMLAENAELTAENNRMKQLILSYGNHPSGFDWGVLGQIDKLEAERDQLKAEAIKATQMMDKATATLLQLDAERDQLRQRVAALEEALRPFAEYAKTTTPGYNPDAQSIFVNHATPRIGDCRRAAELLAAPKPTEPGVAGLFCADPIERPKEGE